MSILTQRIEVYEDSNPIEVSTLDLPVRKGEKILSHEPYAAELMKLYSPYCSDEVMGAISSYEKVGGFRDVCEGFVKSNFHTSMM